MQQDALMWRRNRIQMILSSIYAFIHFKFGHTGLFSPEAAYNAAAGPVFAMLYNICLIYAFFNFITLLPFYWRQARDALLLIKETLRQKNLKKRKPKRKNRK